MKIYNCNSTKIKNLKNKSFYKKSKNHIFNYKCKREIDGKVFELPRKYSYKQCKNMIKNNKMGFTQRSSCSPWFNTKKYGGNFKKNNKINKTKKQYKTINKKISLPKRYIPSFLSKKDKLKQKKEILKSRKMYKKGKYYKRKSIKSYPHKTSKHILNAQKLYNIDSIKPSKELSSASGCSIKAMKNIVKKGMGAMYSSGSRPSQTAHSWAYARLASAITGGKSAAVDFHIIKNGCKKTGKAYKLAIKAREKHKYGTRKVPKIKI